jgi:hypothetical protein
MKFFASIKEFSAFFEAYEFTLPQRMVAVAGAAASITEDKIKRVIGDDSKLKPLSQTTIDLRGGGDTPLYQTGEIIENSIEKDYGEMGLGAFMAVGTSEPIAYYHEHGSVNIPFNTINPARPFFAIGVYESIPEIKEILVALAPGVKVFTVSGKFASLKNPVSMLTGSGANEE